jgi:NADP-dependent 3-hydroxy acid dehydrogenase YdfG
MPGAARRGRPGAGAGPIPPDAVACAIAFAFAVEQPYDVEIGDITIRPAAVTRGPRRTSRRGER